MAEELTNLPMCSRFLRRCRIPPCHQGRYDQKFLLKHEELTRALEGLSNGRVRRIKALFVQIQAAAQAQAEYEPSPPVEAIDSNETQPSVTEAWHGKIGPNLAN